MVSDDARAVVNSNRSGAVVLVINNPTKAQTVMLPVGPRNKVRGIK